MDKIKITFNAGHSIIIEEDYTQFIKCIKKGMVNDCTFLEASNYYLNILDVSIIEKVN